MTTTATVTDDTDDVTEEGAATADGVAAAGGAPAEPEAAGAAKDQEAGGLDDGEAMDPARVRLFRGPRGVLRCTVEGAKSVLRAKVVRAFPLTSQSRWIAVLDGKNKEVCLIEDPLALDAESRRLVHEELEAFYRIPVIRRVNSVENEYRTMYWDVETDCGRREFVLKWASDTIIWLGPDELMLVDIDTNRFHIPSISHLDAHSRQALDVLL